MFTYKTESAFSKVFCEKLRNTGAFVQRIESGSTANGIPDIFCILQKPMWLELKRVKHNIRVHESIPWRAGQRAWLWECGRRGVQTYTIVCYDDVICTIPMYKLPFYDDVIDILPLCNVHTNINDTVKFLYEECK